jgi:hypothetical protein
MRAILAACLAIIGLLAGSATERAAAQFIPGQPYQPNRPFVSPYLNLARPGLGGINYYGLVRPQLDVNRQLQQLQQQQGVLATQVGAATLPEDPTQPAPVGITGHGTNFSNYGHYYYQGLGSSGGSGLGGQTPATAPVLQPRPVRH